MTVDLNARIDELERKLRSLEQELTELRALARTEEQAPVVAQAEAAPPSPQSRLKALANAVRRAQAANDAATLWALAAEAERIAPSADPTWEGYAHRLAEYARAVAGAVKAPAAAATFPARRTAVAEPTAKPVPRRAAPAPKPRGKTLAELVRDWDLLGARGVALAGGVVMLLGIVFFFVLATNRGWIGPLARVSLGAAASALVFAAGIVVHRRYGQLHAALAACGAGIAGGYATLAAATILYALLPAAGALVAAAGIAAAGVVVALAWSSQALAALGLLGAALSPAALALDEGVSAAGTAFAAVVFAALAVVATRRRWERLLVAGAAVTVLQVVWMVGAADAGDTAAAVVAAVVVALLVATATAWQLVLPREGLDALAASFAATAVAVSFGSALHLYPDETEQALALAAAAAGLGIAATLLVRRALDLAYVLGAGALLLAGVATADLLSGTSLAIVFAAQSMLASAIAHRLRERRFLLGAYTYLGVALVEAFAVQSEWADGIASGGEAALGLAASAVAGLAAGLLAPAEAARASVGVLAVLEPLHAWLGRTRVDLRALLAAGAFGLAAIATSDVLSGPWLVVSWAAAAALLAVAAWRFAELRLYPFGLAAALLAAGHAVLLDAPIQSRFSAGAAAVTALAAAGAASLLVGLLVPARQRGISRLGPLADVELALTGLAAQRPRLRFTQWIRAASPCLGD